MSSFVEDPRIRALTRQREYPKMFQGIYTAVLAELHTHAANIHQPHVLAQSISDAVLKLHDEEMRRTRETARAHAEEIQRLLSRSREIVRAQADEIQRLSQEKESAL